VDKQMDESALPSINHVWSELLQLASGWLKDLHACLGTVFVVKQAVMWNPATHAEPQLQRSVQGFSPLCKSAAGDRLTPSPDRARA
jgi:hypothetical protein